MTNTRPVVTFASIARNKLAIIRDEAMELSAMFEFAHAGEMHKHAFEAWEAIQRVITTAEEIMQNQRGELEL